MPLRATAVLRRARRFSEVEVAKTYSIILPLSPIFREVLVMRTIDRFLVCVVACLALLLALPTPGLAQAKIRVAIWEFENHAEHHWWFYNDLGPAARNQIDTEFSENNLLSSKFSVIERDKLNLVLKEQGLASAGAVDPTTAAKVGKILGVKYIILGGVDKFNIDNTRGAVG